MNEYLFIPWHRLIREIRAIRVLIFAWLRPSVSSVQSVFLIFVWPRPIRVIRVLNFPWHRLIREIRAIRVLIFAWLRPSEPSVQSVFLIFAWFFLFESLRSMSRNARNHAGAGFPVLISDAKLRTLSDIRCRFGVKPVPNWC